MKKKYIAPEIEIVRLQHYGDILLGSLTDGEVGAPDLPIDDMPEVPGIPNIGIPGVPGLPGMPSLGPNIPGL